MVPVECRRGQIPKEPLMEKSLSSNRSLNGSLTLRGKIFDIKGT